jgi:hypothetical protein
VDLEEVERQLVVQALERANNNQTRAAELLGLNRDQVRYRMEKFGLRQTLSQGARAVPRLGRAPRFSAWTELRPQAWHRENPAALREVGRGDVLPTGHRCAFWRRSARNRRKWP